MIHPLVPIATECNDWKVKLISCEINGKNRFYANGNEIIYNLLGLLTSHHFTPESQSMKCQQYA